MARRVAAVAVALSLLAAGCRGGGSTATTPDPATLVPTPHVDPVLTNPTTTTPTRTSLTYPAMIP